MKLESAIQTDILKYLKTRPNSFTYKHCPDPVGYPDIEHIEGGKVYLFEVKRSAKHKRSPIQKLRAKQLINAGAVCMKVWELKQVQDALIKL